ncbi:NAD(P)-binding protein [Mesobacillus selenatarsenatis]|uniref:precorrin-2 dehydrogenase n=1 Tax=Mesobacillus selenatarsenatis (strain DSM 18680 / JCM 14380 / FERM P-15431 / SF-1) TaxID=1321606 RepID=A0A0A8X569_MESS1|nr:NAD(P)-binding protein [Mesobacillus selenatarsenatis]GAM14187.1 siroheme synthase/Precorrin-2 oxidase [Mesobacillus selenatarsenatis SF-1]
MLYPINVQIQDRNVVVIGGGKVAQRKVFGLLEAGAKVKVVSPEITSDLLRLSETGEISWRPEPYGKENLEGALLIIAATNDRETNLAVKRDAAPYQLVNLADDPDESDFQVPSVMKRGKLTVAVSTSGASPVLAKKICTQLEEMYDEQYESYLDFLASSRKEIKASVKDELVKRKLLTTIADESFLKESFREERFARLLEETISEEGR